MSRRRVLEHDRLGPQLASSCGGKNEVVATPFRERVVFSVRTRTSGFGRTVRRSCFAVSLPVEPFYKVRDNVG